MEGSFLSPVPDAHKIRCRKGRVQSSVGADNRKAKKRKEKAEAEAARSAWLPAIQQQIADAAALPEVKAQLGRHLQNYETQMDLKSALEREKAAAVGREQDLKIQLVAMEKKHEKALL
jgi:hypothetical protein